MDQIELNAAFQRITQCIDQHAVLIQHRPLTGGVSACIDVLEVERSDGSRQQFVVRRAGEGQWKNQADNTIATEFELQRALFQAGFPIAEQILLDATGQVLPTPFAVMAMVEGTTHVDSHAVDAAMKHMAQFLLRLHTLDRRHINVPGLPEREDPIAGALEFVPDTPQWSALRQAISHWQTTDNPPSVLHGDFWPGNILWQNNRIAAVIDWEDAAIGTAVSDVACCRAEIMAMYGSSAKDLFTRHYLSRCTLDFHDLPLWDVYVSFAALATMHAWGLEPEVEATRRRSTELFAAQAARQVVTA
ncbi:MAG: phosphotransferase family protein [bacterium]